MTQANVQKAPTRQRAITQAYKTRYGRMFHGRIEDALEDEAFQSLTGKVNLIVTSPLFRSCGKSDTATQPEKRI